MEVVIAARTRIAGIALVTLLVGGGMFGALFRSKIQAKRADEEGPGKKRLAFVLLEQERLPRAEDVITSFGRIAPNGLPPASVV